MRATCLEDRARPDLSPKSFRLVVPFVPHWVRPACARLGLLTIVKLNHMQIWTIVLIGLLVTSSYTVTAADTRADARAQVEFGIEVAQKGLWREAIHRWERATNLDQTYAAAWNNLGIAYEHEGLFDKARNAYETALDIEPTNTMIQQNYDLFREINDRINESDR